MHPIFGCMPVYDIYSRRKRRAERGEPEVYQYDSVPPELRVQVRHIIEASGIDFGRVHARLLREMGRFTLSGSGNAREDLLGGIAHGLADVDDWLSVVEYCFFVINGLREWWTPYFSFENPDLSIEELNIRFRQAGFGYQFEGGQIVRVDSQYVHSEVVKPALVLLADPRFAGAEDEFLSAHAHYRAGEYEDAIVDANRAFESTIKAICDIKSWEYPKGARASDLIKVIRRNGLLPDYLDPSFDQLIATLQSGLPKVRNEAGGHGQGATPRKTPGNVAGYALHLAAANIVLLVEALKAAERA